jgi:hypothetical protein
MRSTLLRVRARLSALLVSLTVAAPAAPAILSRRAGSASSDAAVAKGAIVGTGGLLMGLKACATSADDVARAGMLGGRAVAGGGRGLAHTGGAFDDVARAGGTALDDAGRLRPPAVALEDGGRAGLAVEEGSGGARGAGRTSPAPASPAPTRPAPTSAGRPTGDPTALDVAEHVVDAVDLAADLADAAGKRNDAAQEPRQVTARIGGGPGDRPAPQRPSAPWHGRWTDGAVVLQLAPGPGNAGTPAGRGLAGTLTQDGKAWNLVGKLDARGELDAWCVERRSSIHVWGALAADGTLEVRWLARGARLRRAR